MIQGIFVTGTGTNIGKTAVSAAIMHRYRPVAPLRYWKPVQTGSPEDDDTRTVHRLGACSIEEIHPEGIRLPRPLSPHLSARLCGVRIELASILAAAANAGASRACVVEGAGGLLVPLNEDTLIADLILALKLPAVVVALSTLGTINHTLLTLEALRARSIPIAGVIMNGELNPENRRAIEHYGSVPVLGEMPPLAPLTAEVLAHWAFTELDPEGLLDPLFKEPRP
ncbi:MAG: dethiobiotin synthase [Bryobacteraceae bacterium]